MVHLRCPRCGAFISLKNRFMEGATSNMLIQCSKCFTILTVPFEYDCLKY